MTAHRHRVSNPAAVDRDNEDALWEGDDLAVLVDGAGLPKDLRAGCGHSVAWFAGSVAEGLGRQLGDPAVPMEQALGRTLEGVAGSHGDDCDLTAGSPSGTVVAWRAVGEELELLVLCDSSVILVAEAGAEGGHGAVEHAALTVRHVSDDRIDDVVHPQVAALVAQDEADGTLLDGPRRFAHHRTVLEATRNVPGGFWCAHTDPAPAGEAVVWTEPIGSWSHVILASDGATRAFQTLGTHTLEQLVTDCLSGRLEEISEAVRAAESAAQDELRAAGKKVHDDLTILVTALS